MLRDSSQLNSTINYFKRESTVKKSASDHSSNNSKSATTFLACILHILQAFFKTAFQRDSAKNSEPAFLSFDRSSSLKGVCLLRGYSHSLLPSQLNLAAVSSTSDGIPSHAISSLCDFFAVLWSNTSLSESVVSNASILTMTEICKVAGLLFAGTDSASLPSYFKFLEKAFENYPYISRESTVSAPDSSSAISGSKLSRLLNIHLTELVLQTGESDKVEYIAGINYLTDSLNDYVSCLQGTSSSTLRAAHVERVISAWGTVFKTSNCSSDVVASTLALFKRLADEGSSSGSPENYAMLFCIYNCTCEFVDTLSTNADCSSDASGERLVVMGIFKTFAIAWRDLPGEDSAHYCRRIVESFLKLLRQFPHDEETLIAVISDLFSSLLDSGGILERCSAEVRARLMEALLYLPKQTYVASVHRFAVTLAQRVELQSEVEQFFSVVYVR